MANFALDYDNTYTLDPDLWRSIIPLMLVGHDVYVVTSRGMDTPIELIQDFIEWKIKVVYCGYRAKKQVCIEQGIHIDVWMDDDPRYIEEGFLPDDQNPYYKKHLEEDTS